MSDIHRVTDENEPKKMQYDDVKKPIVKGLMMMIERLQKEV